MSCCPCKYSVQLVTTTNAYVETHGKIFMPANELNFSNMGVGYWTLEIYDGQQLIDEIQFTLTSNSLLPKEGPFWWKSKQQPFFRYTQRDANDESQGCFFQVRGEYFVRADSCECQEKCCCAACHDNDAKIINLDVFVEVVPLT